MWRLGLLVCASCTLLPGTAARSERGENTDENVPITSSWTMKPPITMPISDKPADPWTAVKGDNPVTFEDEDSPVTARWEVKKRQLACTAARDHCLPPISWMWVSAAARGPTRQAFVVAFTAYGPRTPNGLRWGQINPDPYVAYRTVPATKTNLVPGVLAMAYPDPFPTEVSEVYTPWTIGKVERVDWDLGMAFFEDDGEPRMITGVRVAVLGYEPGGKVTVLDGKQRDQLAVKPADVILPAP